MSTDTPSAAAERPVAAETRLAHVIVVGNEKGGAGKSTVAMHLCIALLRMGMSVGVLDLDVRQRSLSRYLENRMRWMRDSGKTLPMPEMVRIDPSQARDLDAAEKEEARHFDDSLKRLSERNNFIIIDAPGGDTFLSRLAHSAADTLITPLNDSFVDFDLLGDVDPRTMEVARPSFYSELVWDCRKRKAAASRRQIDWVVMRNRVSPLDARNKQRVGEALDSLARRVGFRLAPGMSERVIYRELFPMGLSLLDLTDADSGVTLTMSHVAARQEIRDMLIVLKLPGLEGKDISF
ncbi:MAG: division plane positioning ATPase MipZ [Hyphomonadaceae bacterium]